MVGTACCGAGAVAVDAGAGTCTVCVTAGAGAVRATVSTVRVVVDVWVPPPKIVVFLEPATEPPNTSSEPVRKNAATAKPMTPVDDPEHEPRAPARAASTILLPQAEGVVAALPRGHADVVAARSRDALGRCRAPASSRAAGRRSPSPTIPTMIGRDRRAEDRAALPHVVDDERGDQRREAGYRECLEGDAGATMAPP